MSKIRAKLNNYINVAEENGFISSLVNLGQFKKNCEELLPKTEVDFRKKEDFDSKSISKEMGVSEETIKELEGVCNTSSLTCPREVDILHWEDLHSIPEDSGLLTLDHWKRFNETKYERSTRLLKSKYTELSCALHAQALRTPAKSEEDKVLCPESVITVCVCLPRDFRRHKACNVDYFVLGSQKLTELRDKIMCVLSEQPVGDFTSNPDHPKDIKLKDICTSSLFFIENTFFNDMRTPQSFEMSKSLIEWAESGDSFIPPDTQSVSMEDYTFDDLNVRLGCPYIFLHQGDCEHVVIFKDIRLFNSNDCQSRSSYPFAVSRPNRKGSPCQVCGLYASTWLTRGDTLTYSDPAFFCERCFKTLHYDKQGKKLGEFKAFPRTNVVELNG